MTGTTPTNVPADARELLENERHRLKRMKAEALGDERGSTERSDLGELSNLDQHPADLGTEVFEREKDLSIIETIDGELEDIEAALGRLDDGSYGNCERCGSPIGKERLEAVPYARLCIEDQTKMEATR